MNFVNEFNDFIELTLKCGDIKLICFIVIMYFIISTLVLITHFCLYKVFDIKLLEIDEDKSYVWVLWILGGITSYLILYFLNVVAPSIQSIIIVCITWNVLVKNTFDSLRNQTTITKDIQMIDQSFEFPIIDEDNILDEQ